MLSLSLGLDPSSVLKSISPMRTLEGQVLENVGLFRNIQSFLAPMPDERASSPYPKTILMESSTNQELIDNELNDHHAPFSYKRFTIWTKNARIKIPDFFEINSLARVTRKCADNFRKINKKAVIEQRMVASKVLIYLNQEMFSPSYDSLNFSANGFSKALNYSMLERNLEVLEHLLNFDVNSHSHFVFSLLGQFTQILCMMSAEFSEEKQKFCERASEIIFDKIKQIDLSVVYKDMGGLLQRLANCKRSIGFDWLMTRVKSLSEGQQFIFKEKLAQENFTNNEGVSLLYTAIKQGHFSIVKQTALHFPIHHAKMLENLSEDASRKLKNLTTEELLKG